MIYFEDLYEGMEAFSPKIVVDEEEMLEYNRKYDPWPFHVDEEAARASLFGGISASGGYTISLTYLLSHRIFNTPEGPWAMLGGNESRMKLPAPVYAGDTLRYSMKVIRKRPSSKPGRGIVTILETMTNQKGDTVFTAETVLFVATRPGGE